jgi:hypothetical protein
VVVVVLDDDEVEVGGGVGTVIWRCVVAPLTAFAVNRYVCEPPQTNGTCADPLAP